jgi:hypothetical protein
MVVHSGCERPSRLKNQQHAAPKPEEIYWLSGQTSSHFQNQESDRAWVDDVDSVPLADRAFYPRKPSSVECLFQIRLALPAFVPPNARGDGIEK